MKLVKKALAGMMALAMAASAMVSLTVTSSADELPALYPVITVDENAKTATVEVRGKNLPTEITNGGYTDPAYIFAFGCTVDVSSYSTETIYGMTGRNFTTWKNNHFVNGPLGYDPLQAGTAGYEGFLSYGGAFTSVNAAKAVGQVQSDMTFFTVKDIPLSDDALANGFTVAVRDTQIILNNEYWGTGDAYEVGLKTNNGTAAAESASWAPAVATAEPTAVPTAEPTAVPTAEPTAAPTEAPTANWVDAVVTEFTSVADNSFAIAAKATLDGEDGKAFNAVTWKVAAGGVTKGKVSRLKATLDGAGSVTVGLAIGGLHADGTEVKAALGDWSN